MKQIEVDHSSCSYSFKKDQVLPTEDAWGFCIVALYFGTFPGMKAFDEMRASWKVPNQYKFHPTGYTLFKFECEEDRALVLANGPYSLVGVPWMMKEMPPFFQFDDDCFNNIPVWVKFPMLPLELFGEEALNIVASFVGRPLMTDQFTKDLTKGAYARVLVEVDVTKPLVRELSLEMPNGKKIVQPVLFEIEPKICLKCRTLGHNKEECRGKGPTQRGRSKSRGRKSRQKSRSRANSLKTAVHPNKPLVTTAVLPSQNVQQPLTTAVLPQQIDPEPLLTAVHPQKALLTTAVCSNPSANVASSSGDETLATYLAKQHVSDVHDEENDQPPPPEPAPKGKRKKNKGKKKGNGNQGGGQGSQQKGNGKQKKKKNKGGGNLRKAVCGVPSL